MKIIWLTFKKFIEGIVTEDIYGDCTPAIIVNDKIALPSEHFIEYIICINLDKTFNINDLTIFKNTTSILELIKDYGDLFIKEI